MVVEVVHSEEEGTTGLEAGYEGMTGVTEEGDGVS